jgi:hypothetical protein
LYPVLVVKFLINGWSSKRALDQMAVVVWFIAPTVLML